MSGDASAVGLPVLRKRFSGGTWRSEPNMPSRLNPPGVVGLNNLGNTCFMNAVLQCFSHTPPLTAYFLDPAWQVDINMDRTVCKGALCKAYGALVQQLWSGSSRSVKPSELKKVRE